MAWNNKHNFRDRRTGRFRKAASWEKNNFFKVDTLSRGLANFTFKTLDQMAGDASSFAEEMLDYARKNAPWTDRTGEARAGLDTAVAIDNDTLEVFLFHTAEYGQWLEVRWGGKYAIIIPTVETMGIRLLAKMNNTLGEIIYYRG